MTSKRLTLTFGVLWIAACNASVPETQEASDLSKSATAPVTETTEFDALMEEFKEEVADGTDEGSEMLIIGNTLTDDSSLEKQQSSVAQEAAGSGKEVIDVEMAAYPAVTLRRGETIAHFARWSGSTVEEIAELSSVSLDGEYPVGLELTLPITNETLASVEEKREAHRVARVDGYLASRGGSEQSEFYTVKTGDTAWSISKNQQGIPVWVLESYNPSVNLDRLRPGQELMVPVLTDTLVDAGAEE